VPLPRGYGPDTFRAESARPWLFQPADLAALDALAAGQRDPHTLAAMALGGNSRR
jgi:hypothetical protein